MYPLLCILGAWVDLEQKYRVRTLQQTFLLRTLPTLLRKLIIVCCTRGQDANQKFLFLLNFILLTKTLLCVKKLAVVPFSFLHKMYIIYTSLNYIIIKRISGDSFQISSLYIEGHCQQLYETSFIGSIEYDFLYTYSQQFYKKKISVQNPVKSLMLFQ